MTSRWVQSSMDPASPASARDTASEADPAALPEDWNAVPHGQASAAFGGSWLRAGQHLGLVLPSVVVPQARNLLLNPLHPAMEQVSLVHQEPFQLDQRLG